MSTNYTGGLNFTWPTKGDLNWDGNVDTSLTRISGHDHSGGGNGTQLTTSAIANDSVTGVKIRLANAEYLRGRNTANSADVNLVRVTASSQPEYQGTTTNDSATAGAIGEVIGPVSRLRSVGVALVTGTAANTTITNITLTPGDWWVTGAIGYLPGATTNVTQVHAAVSKTSNTLPVSDTLAVPTAGEFRALIGSAASVPNADLYVPIPPYRVSVSVSTPLFLVAQAVFTVSSMQAYGFLEAHRAR